MTAVHAINSAGGNAIVATSSGVPIYAESSTTNSAYGALYGKSTGSTSGNGVYGTAQHYGIGVKGVGGSVGVFGIATAGGANGVVAFAQGSAGEAVYAVASDNATVAGHFIGHVSKSSGTFVIDHPLDPANRYLRHSFVESPDMKNIYDGVATADANGEIRVKMPGYFDALNRDFRYQLTPIGGPAPNLHVSQELDGEGFTISGANPGQRVSWQATGCRKDAWAVAHPVIVEEDKPPHEKGLYRHPEVHGEPSSKGIAHNKFNLGGGPS